MTFPEVQWRHVATLTHGRWVGVWCLEIGMLSLRALCCLRLGRCLSEVALESRTGEQRLMVAGLGNHGMAGTRHSVGMAVVNQLARRLDIAEQWKTDKQCGADLVLTSIGQVQVVLLKPRQLMNINGRSVASAAGKFRLTPESIYLLHDELDKPLGKMSLKLGGSARGHNGVRSCIERLQSDNMVRLRVGIGRPVGHSSVERHVLGRFTGDEQEILPRVLEQGVELVLAHIMQRSGTIPSAKTLRNAEEGPNKS
ncbi:peptidyl-tRNA hydrolase [Ascaphus truei]|uniref:peptidyl-tRNA hydrolase n=1 Tax=Ascaphus truei TaxID=8439 RepID=UPI003F5AD6D8